MSGIDEPKPVKNSEDQEQDDQQESKIVSDAKPEIAIDGPASPTEPEAEPKPKGRKSLPLKGKVLIGIAAAAIAFGAAYVATNGFHQHSWSDATCTQPKTCTECEATEGEALGHDYVVSSENDATCTQSAYVSYVCTRCDDAYDEETGEAALGHDPGDWSFDSTTQKMVRRCTRCSAICESQDITREGLAPLLASWKATLDECYKHDSGSSLKSLYKDQVYVKITNHSSNAIRSATVNVCAWNDSGDPVRIGYLRTTNDMSSLDCADMNIRPDESWDCEELNVGFPIASNLTDNISKVEGVIESVTYADGTTETNPYAQAWLSLYKGKAN